MLTIMMNDLSYMHTNNPLKDKVNRTFLRFFVKVKVQQLQLFAVYSN